MNNVRQLPSVVEFWTNEYQRYAYGRRLSYIFLYDNRLLTSRDCKGAGNSTIEAIVVHEDWIIRSSPNGILRTG
jgi:hypothetical protein